MRPTIRTLGFLLIALSAAGFAPAKTAQDWRPLWNDGQAELDSYSLVQPRYGQLRKGSVVFIFVKETFSESDRVKAEPGRHPPADELPVMKLNVVKDFQTGIYDYNLMMSVFVGLEAHGGRSAGTPAKIVFSAQEWCGAMFEELLFDERVIRQRRFSYFDGEGDETRDLDRPAGGMTIDELPIAVRGLPAFAIAPGTSRELPLLPSLERARLLHRPLGWTMGRLARDGKAKSVTVPAGRFDVETWTAEVGGDRWEWDVEVAYPHRITGWRGPDGERAELLGSERMKYWELNREGDEKRLAPLGLRPQPAPGR